MGSALESVIGLTEGIVGVVERVLLVAPTCRAPTRWPHIDARGASMSWRSSEPSGELSWVVSNGDDRATCNSAAFAERVKVCLG